MKKLLGYADEYVQHSTWKDFALVKFCLLSVGLMIGVALPKRAKKPFAFAAMAVFTATYLPLMTKFFRIVTGKSEK